MGYQILLNILIACVWMFLYNEWSLQRFAYGYVMGLALIFILRRFWPEPFYLRKLWALLKLLALFVQELFISGLTVVLQILRPVRQLKPGIFAYRTELRSDWEVTLLSCLICLTPGTLTLEVSRDGHVLYIHAMDIRDKESVTEQIRNTFEKAIMEVTR